MKITKKRSSYKTIVIETDNELEGEGDVDPPMKEWKLDKRVVSDPDKIGSYTFTDGAVKKVEDKSLDDYLEDLNKKKIKEEDNIDTIILAPLAVRVLIDHAITYAASTL